jgi:hypothetical protein
MRERLARAAQTAGRIEKSRWDKVSQLEKKQRRATRAAADAPDNKYNAAEQKRQALQAAKSAATESAKRASRRGARLRLAAATSAQLKPAIRGKGRIRMARPAGTVAKPKGLRAGEIERRSLNRASRDYAAIDARDSRAKANAGRLRGQLSMAEMQRDQNPYPKGKAAARKERKRRQSIVDGIQKRLNRQYGAQVMYDQRRKAVDSRLTAIGKSRTAWSSVPQTSKNGATHQGNLFGGSDATYRPRKPS